MARTIRLQIGGLLVLLALTALWSPAQVVEADGVGVFPAQVSFEEVLRGGEYFRSLGVQNESDSEKTFQFDKDGPMAPWMTFVDPIDNTKVIERLQIPARDQARVYVRLRVPSDAPNGLHKASSLVAGLSVRDPQGRGSQSNVNVGVEVPILATVTGTQRIAASLLDMTVEDTEVGIPLLIKAKIANSGNVQFKPLIRGSFVDDKGRNVDSQTFLLEEGVAPQETKTIIAKWDTVNALPGRYVATIEIEFGGLDLGKRQLPFGVLQRGAFTRQGTLESLKLVNKPNPGETAKITATLANTGKIESKSVVVGELYRGSTLLKAVTSQERLLPAGAVGTTDLFLEALEKGSYTFKAKANFEGKETETQDLVINVGVSPSEGLNPWLIIGAGAAILSVALLVFAKGGLGGPWFGGRIVGTGVGQASDAPIPLAKVREHHRSRPRTKRGRPDEG